MSFYDRAEKRLHRIDNMPTEKIERLDFMLVASTISRSALS